VFSYDTLLLGVVQGVSEVLPISSSANLFLFTSICNIQGFSFSLKVALHAGSLIAFFVYFHSEISSIFRSFCLENMRLRQTYFWHLIVGTAPVVILGFLAHDFVIEFDSRKIMGISSIFFGMLLLIADKISALRSKQSVSIVKAFVIGCFQAISIFPGVSRLGITITASRMLSIDRRKAIFFSMFLAIPSICGSLVLEIINLIEKRDLMIFSTDTLYGMAVTTIVSMIAIYPCSRFMEKRGFFWISMYRVVIGCVIIFL
jgi:undecaprenyl-diphosphatase